MHRRAKKNENRMELTGRSAKVGSRNVYEAPELCTKQPRNVYDAPESCTSGIDGIEFQTNRANRSVRFISGGRALYTSSLRCAQKCQETQASDQLDEENFRKCVRR